jgi:hypothetical protein
MAFFGVNLLVSDLTKFIFKQLQPSRSFVGSKSSGIHFFSPFIHQHLSSESGRQLQGISGYWVYQIVL